MKLLEVFKRIQEYPSEFVSAGTGEQFENIIEQHIKSAGYTKLPVASKPQQWKAIKKAILLKEKVKPIANAYEHYQEFMVMPNGSQDYPDFLVFENSCLVCIETKFNKGNTGKPVWNSGLPRPNGIYILGSYPKRDVTFFMGGDVVSEEDVRRLRGFFDEGLPEYTRKWNLKAGKNQRYGFGVYVRRAFEQSKKNNPDAILDFYSNPYREELEEKVLGFLSE